MNIRTEIKDGKAVLLAGTTETHLADGMRDLESCLCDAYHAARIAEEQFTGIFCGPKRGHDGNVTLTISTREWDQLSFAIGQASSLVDRLHDQYYECVHSTPDHTKRVRA